MKGKSYAIIVMTLLFVGIASVGVAMYKSKESIVLQDIGEVIHTSVVLEGQPFYAKFATSIQSRSLKNGAIKVKNEEGKTLKIKAQIIQGRLLAISDLPAGNYQFIAEVNTLKEKMPKKQKINFTVYEMPEKITAEEDLKRYFAANEQSRQAQNLYDFVDYDGAEMANEEKASTAMDSASSAEPTAAGDTGYSDTNNQVAGIEEGDTSLTDGTYLYTMRDQHIHIFQTKPLKQLTKIKGDDNSYPIKMIRHQQYLLVFYDSYRAEKDYYQSFTEARIYDVTDIENPVLVREVGQEGYASGIRLMNDTLYMTTIKYDIPSVNSQLDLRPALYDDVNEKSYVDYEDIAIFPHSMGDAYTVISALALNSPKTNEFVTTAYLGEGGAFYMSENAMYMAVAKYNVMPIMTNSTTNSMEDRIMAEPIWWQPTETTVYKYAIEGTAISRVGEASVKGTVLNQFSMDEHAGHFRIATTEGNAGLQNANSNNHLTIFNDQMQQVGFLTDLARGERIYSVRYMGDKAYIVTFKETDPLFVIDVADPSNPNVLGELKIPGFSNYLHPLSETHLIGIGYDTEVQTGKENLILTQGIKVSLFDVTDVHNPKEVDVEIIGGRGTYSEVQYNHLALYRDLRNSYFGFPIMVYEQDQYMGTGAAVFKITEQGIDLTGKLWSKNAGDQYENWDDMVSRMLYSDDTMYTVGHGSIKAYDRQSLTKLEELKIK